MASAFCIVGWVAVTDSVAAGSLAAGIEVPVFTGSAVFVSCLLSVLAIPLEAGFGSVSEIDFCCSSEFAFSTALTIGSAFSCASSLFSLAD